MLLFTGKGGVGKTSVAAATAVHAAAAGARVLVTSTDPAHSLADALAQPLDDRPRAVDVPGAPGRLTGLQIDAQARLEHHWSDVRDYLVSLLGWGGMGAVAAEELILLPGIDELFALIDLEQQVASGEYDLVVVDCAPTAETLRLLALPDALGWYVERIAGPGRRMARALGPLVRGAGLGALPMPDEPVFAAVERIQDQLARVHTLLQDPARAAIRLVCTPERLSVAETERTATSLSLFGYGVDALVVNRVLPDEVTDPYLARWKDRHAAQLAELRTSFAPTPVLRAPLLDDEVIGVDGLRRLADALYADADATGWREPVRPVTVERTAEGHLLRIALPFATRGELDLHRRGSDLHVRVAGVRRTVALPGSLRRDRVAGAALADGWLEVRFRPQAAGVEVGS
ncbi:ArsA family ATPase [Egicoccus halophilus]|uniref:arsenite-transporting ATPase n=1 Tax=Egicoccus halophilus TaxID=1670830 RepID=A0A8J3AFY2_9ACTN|nr:ArsA family ATPase [Egicoccus halophilus]GGI07269.1 arsenic-transporting ATPase [Egicoccus halophilus]